MSETFNLRNPEPGEVAEIHRKAQQRIRAKERYRVLSQLLSGKKDVDITVSPEIFEVLNKEKMEFELLMSQPQNKDNVEDCIKQAREDRERYYSGGDRSWNPKSKAKWGCLGHIPHCVFYARPTEYWKNKNLVRNFFNTFTKFRVSSRRV